MTIIGRNFFESDNLACRFDLYDNVRGLQHKLERTQSTEWAPTVSATYVSETRVTCRTPPFPNVTGTVYVRVSIDGIAYSTYGAVFGYNNFTVDRNDKVQQMKMAQKQAVCLRVAKAQFDLESENMYPSPSLCQPCSLSAVAPLSPA